MKKITDQELRFYTGIRFAQDEASASGADCFGIIKLFNKREYGFEIGSFSSDLKRMRFKDIDSHFNELIKTKWREVKEPYTGCTVAIANIKYSDGSMPVDHVGIYVYEGKMINTNRVLEYSAITGIDKSKIIGFYEFIGEE